MLSPPSIKEPDDSRTASPSDSSITSLSSLHAVKNVPFNESASPTAFKPSRNFILAFASICVITIAAALDATSLSIALPIITEKLKGTAIQAFWSGTSFLLTSAVFQPVIAGLSHVFGRKEIILISSLFFAVGSIVAAVAKDFTYMLVGRSIQGIGGGGILTLGEILVTDLVPLAARGAWFGYLGAMWALGSVTGPLMGGAFAQNVTWRWIFWINLPFIGLGSVAIIFFLKIDKLPGNVVSKIKNFDWIGSVVFIASTVAFLIPVSWGGVMYAWDSWRVLFPLIMGVFGVIGFALWEWRLSKKAFDAEGIPIGGDMVEPIIRFSIFNNRTMVITYFQTILHGIILWSLLYFLPLYYEGVKGYTPIVSGVAMLPESGFVAPMAVAVGVACAITGRYRWAIWVGWVLTTLGSGLLLLLKPSSPILAWVLLNILVSIGTGMLFPAMGLGVQAAGRPRDAGHAAAFYSFTRVFGQSIGVAISGVAFQNQVKNKLMDYPDLAPFASQYSKDATALVTIIKMMPAGDMKTNLVTAYNDSLGSIWILMTALAAVGLISSLFVKGYSLNQELDTKQKFNGDVKIKDVEMGQVVEK
ncbi:major facilitator superfamily domain-containing protein [Amylocarpus encephaloides]|uniref:Major facilitator superfamily domain-containing protein n=1 Tax=Amylocarpus encephaloides TaxID=45428 RepID=A0A9P7YFX7_9HELO|nr:major facilitator superfamily domain-containing protein [Amylocarpus encephaloides]